MCIYIYTSWSCIVLSCVQLFVTLWNIAHQAPLSVGFSRWENWSGLPFPSSGDLPNPRIEPVFLSLQVDSLLAESSGKPIYASVCVYICACVSLCILCMYLHMFIWERDIGGIYRHGIFQKRILEWVAISFFRGSSQPRDWTRSSYVSCLGRRVLYH